MSRVTLLSVDLVTSRHSPALTRIPICGELAMRLRIWICAFTSPWHGAVATEDKLGSKDFNWNCDVDLQQVVRGGWCGTWRRGEVRGLIVCV